MKLSDTMMRVVVTSIWITIGLVIFGISATMANPIGQPIGPGYVPSLIAGLMVIAGAMALVDDIKRLRRQKKTAPKADLTPAGVDRKAWGEIRVLVLTVLIFLGTYIWGKAGYLIGMSLVVLVLILIDKKIAFKWAVPFAALISVVHWLIFSVALQTDIG